MKSIQIIKLTLQNFKGQPKLELDFGGKDASIFGDNATGKTTVFDALTWLLFGKDSRGSADQEIFKPLDRDGEIQDHQAVTCVEAELVVRGVEDAAPYEIILRKEMKEAWVSRRGSTQLVYDGNLFNYFIDGVPMKKNEFTKRVGELVDEETFKMLTSVTAFAQDLNWKKRREILYELSGVSDLSDRALLQQAAAESEGEDGDTFRQLAELMGSRSLEDLGKILQQKKKNLSGVKDQTPARIDELSAQELRLAGLDFTAAELEAAAARDQIDAIRRSAGELRDGVALAEARKAVQGAVEQLRALEDENRNFRAERQKQRKPLTDAVLAVDNENRQWVLEQERQKLSLRGEISRLEDENRAYHWKQKAEQPDPRAAESRVRQLEQALIRETGLATDDQAEADTLDKMAQRDREEWLRVNAEAFTGGTCPTCGQELPMAMLEEARTKFEEAKAGRLKQIQEIGMLHKRQAMAASDRADHRRAAAEQLQADLEQARKDLESARAAQEPARDMDDYRERLEALKAKLEALETTGDMPGCREKREAALATLAAFDKVTDMEGYADRKKALEAEKSRLEAQEASLIQDEKDRMNMLRAKEKDAQARLDRANNILGERSILVYVKQRIEELRGEQRKAAAELENTSGMLYAIETFIRWKTRFVEDSVNGLFRLVSFRLFREQANGGLEERCDVVVDGVPYSGLNNGMRVNAGLDIIRRLAEHYGVRVPLFVDNAEGVTRLEDAGTQVIRLVVSEQDKSLRMEIAGGQ